MDDDVRDVGTLAPDPLLDLAGARVRVVEAARAVEAEREERYEPTVGPEEAQRARVAARRVAHDATDDRFVVRLGLARLARLARLGQRLEVRLHAADLRNGGEDRRLQLLRDVVRLVEREVAGQLDVQRKLLAPAD